MKKATHNGTCQICGRQHAVNPTLAKHGYTVDYGFFNGICPGAEALPLETDRTISDQWAKHLREESAKLLASTTDDITSITLYSRPSWKQEKIEAVVNNQEEVDELYRTIPHFRATYYGRSFEDHKKAELYVLHSKGSLLGKTASIMDQRADRITGNELTPRPTEAKKERFTFNLRPSDPAKRREVRAEVKAKIEALKSDPNCVKHTTRTDSFGRMTIIATMKD